MSELFVLVGMLIVLVVCVIMNIIMIVESVSIKLMLVILMGLRLNSLCGRMWSSRLLVVRVMVVGLIIIVIVL